jgi:Outer membrane protein beta-barrel domain
MDEHLQNNVDSFFRNSLHQTRHDPSEEVWNKIEHELNKEDRKVILIKNRRRVLITASLLIGLIGLSIFTSIQLRENHLPVVNLSDPSSITPKSPYKVLPESLISNREPLKNKTGPKRLNFNSGAVVKAEKKSIQSLFGITNICCSPIQITALKLPSFLPDPVVLPATVDMHNKVTIKHQEQSFIDRISVTPYFSKEFAGYNFTDEDSTSPGGKEVEQRERNIFSASLGIYINYKLNKKWVLQTGLSYSWSSTNIDSSICYAVNDNNGRVQFKLNTITGYGYLQPSSSVQPNVGDSLLAGKAYSQLHYLTIPFVLSYNIPLKRFSLLVGGGVSFNILTSAAIETKTYGSAYPEKEYVVNMMGLKKTNYGILVKADLEYHISSALGIHLIPSFKNTLSPINLRTAVSAYPYNFGIGIGLSYRLR